MEAIAFIALVAACAPMVDLGTARALVSVESSFNPHAIGVVHGVLERQPHSRAEALATTRNLRENGWNYSAGLAQINARNFARLGLSADEAFEPCANLRAMQTILQECFERAQGAERTSTQLALRQSFSCYYSGNFVTGFGDGYVGRVIRAAQPPGRTTPTRRFAKETS
jgi:type IV secretion system protein VirB1